MKDSASINTSKKCLRAWRSAQTSGSLIFTMKQQNISEHRRRKRSFSKMCFTRQKQHQQQVIDVVGGVEVGHALTVQQVAQWDLVQRPQHLGDGHSAGQNGRAAQETLSARQSATSLLWVTAMSKTPKE